MIMVALYKSPWRIHFESLLAKTKTEIIISSPYIKKREAELICEQLDKRSMQNKLQFRLLTDLRSQSILDNSLDIQALQIFQENITNFQLLTLTRLHSKVYIFDSSYAVVGSANLTPSGFEYNYEYSVGLSEKQVVLKIRNDIDEYSHLGSIVEKNKVNELSIIAAEVKSEYQRVVKSATSEIKRKFSETLRRADKKFSEALVGKKSAYSIFKDTVIYCLTKESLSTNDLQTKIQMILPDLCVDKELVINGQRFGKAWKHQVRTVLNDLRRRGNLKAINKIWQIQN